MNRKRETLTKLKRTCLAMFVVGNIYNVLYWRSYHRKMAFELTVFWVVVGVMFNIVGLGYVAGKRVAISLFMLFASSGLPMVFGAMWQYYRRLIEEQRYG